MDALTGLLDGPRARGAFLLRSVLDPPWSLRIQDGSPLSLITMVRGDAWILKPDHEPARIGAGDVAVVNGVEPYVVADEPGTAPQVIIHPGQRCQMADGSEVTLTGQGVRTWGTRPDAPTVMVSGTYQMHSEVSRRMLDALPGLLIRPAEAGDRSLIDLLVREMNGTEPAQDLVLDRLLDLVLVSVLRSWLATPADDAPGWQRAQTDPVVGPALRVIHDDPAYGWTVASLAARTGVSRASLARRFTEVVGESPMAYLTSWRLTLAADLLRQGDATLESVARRVGYGSAFALSTAFKRERGVSPQEYRRRPPLAPHASPLPRVVRLT
ncbi:AraC family transcriptional regulator [Paractinoplanes abujensis]|uniref:AraC-like DNA-binding protein n=1 Tax=Paractinoplanes abujensis TaxID=882441 RepID=A0A7W7G345_9ACTN|nr:AraC family transcriptional regulator [Actinoplanes abujensis]MBB4692321.1 AraC-like DNA-binding protein [Actinoplanes abujensis]GID24201.1 AraC family transcriptional regulator [Actinoplanes abujensis]